MDPKDDPAMNDLLSSLGNSGGATEGAKPTPTTAAGATTHRDMLVGEGKQYKDDDAVAKGKLDADRFIIQLQNEAKEMVSKMEALEAQADTKAALSEVLNELRNRSPNEPGTPNPGISEEDLARRVEQLSDKYAVKKTQEANQAAANMALLKRFDGDASKAKAYLDSRLSELHITSDTVRNLARTSPAAFSELLGLTKKEASTSTNITGGSYTMPTDVTRNNSYYNGLLKEMGSSKFYKNKDVLNQREQDINRLGDAFFA